MQVFSLNIAALFLIFLTFIKACSPHTREESDLESTADQIQVVQRISSELIKNGAHCFAGVGNGAVEGAQNFIPGLISMFKMAGQGASEVLRRNLLLAQSIYSSDARNKVIQIGQTDEDKAKAAVQLIGQIIHTVYEYLNGTSNFNSLPPHEQSTVMCRVLGRISFDLLTGEIGRVAAVKLGSQAKIALNQALTVEARTHNQFRFNVGGNSLKARAAAFLNGIDGKFGVPKPPAGGGGIKIWERVDINVADSPVRVNPSRQVFSLQNPSKNLDFTSPLEPGQQYIWLVTGDNKLVIAKELSTTYVVNAEKRWFGRLGHPTLSEGKPARIAGEVKINTDGSLTINNKSGRYSAHPDRGEVQLENARQLMEIAAGKKVTASYINMNP